MAHWCDMHLSLQNGDTSLMMASRGGYDGCVLLLLDRGAQVDHQNTVSAFWNQPSISSYHMGVPRGGGGRGGHGPPPSGLNGALPPPPPHWLNGQKSDSTPPPPPPLVELAEKPPLPPHWLNRPKADYVFAAVKWRPLALIWPPPFQKSWGRPCIMFPCVKRA